MANHTDASVHITSKHTMYTVCGWQLILLPLKHNVVFIQDIASSTSNCAALIHFEDYSLVPVNA